MNTLADASVRSAMIDRVKTVKKEAPPKWGRMTANQMLCHCTDSFKCALGERIVSSRTGVFQRTVVKTLALWMPVPWPKGLPTLPEVEQGVGGTPPVDFATDLSDLLQSLERFCLSDFRSNGANHPAYHPLFGLMSAREWKRWGYLHLDHHLRQFGA